MLIDEVEQIRINKIWQEKEITSRGKYRSVKKENPKYNLPNDKVIGKQFGSFSSFKQLMDETSKKREVLITLSKVFNKFKISNRKEFRIVRKSYPKLNIISEHQVEKIFKSFTYLKFMIGVEEMNDISDDLSIEELKIQVKRKRELMFGKNKTGRWNPKLRNGRWSEIVTNIMRGGN